jgi:hypothetical protein
MAERLKNVLQFTNLAPGASVALPHDLHTSAPRPLSPDVVFIPNPGLDVTSDTINVTLLNKSGVTLSGAILVEAWHTIERAFNDVNDEDLPVKPYVVVSVEGGNEPPWPPFPVIAPGQNITTTIYARSTGNDTTGKGTLAKPYRTFQRSIRDVPPQIDPGYRFVIDITGIGLETLPQDWACPPITCSQEHLWDFLAFDVNNPPYFVFATPLTVRAIPQLVAGITPNQINSGAGATVSAVGPGLVKVTVPGATWIPGALKGLLAIKTLSSSGGLLGGGGLQAIFDNTATELFLSNTPAQFNGGAGPLVLQPGEVLAIMEPSAVLAAPPADIGQKEPIEFGGIDAINFQGIGFQSTAPINAGSGSVLINTVTNPGFEGCVLNESTYQGCRGLGIFFLGCTMRGLFDAYDCAGLVENSFFGGVGTSVGFPSFRVFGQGLEIFNTVFDGCSSFGGGQPDIFGIQTLIPVAWQLGNCWLRNSLGDAFTVRAPTRVDMATVQIDGAMGNGVIATGPCQLLLTGLTGSGNTGYGVVTDDGAHVKVDVATTTIGNTDGRAYTNGSVAPVAMWPVAAFSDVDIAGAAATLSRVSGT